MSVANQYEVQMLTLINRERAAEGLAPLRLNFLLNASAETHSRWMNDADVFSHSGSGGSSAGDRMRDAGYVFSGSWTWGENIAWQSLTGAEGISDDVVDRHNALMNSPGHRANILNPEFVEIGIGIEVGEFTTNGRTWLGVMVTQNFARSSADNGGPEGPVVFPVTEGADVVDGTANNDFINGLGGHDRLNGLVGNDILHGGSGNDTLTGGVGNDTMLGGSGDDSYIIDVAGDRVFETTTTSSLVDAGGTDTVLSVVSFDLDASAGVRFVERLTLSGTANINGTGNALANILIGNSGNNVLNGGIGNDTLNGWLGNDTMLGGAGNDIYVVDVVGDRVFETTTTASVIDAGGIDMVLSAITFNLDASPGVQFVERLMLIGTANINGIGNALANVLTGNSGNNILNGGLGNDIMLGGAGNDTYVVNAPGDQVFETTTAASLIDAGGIDMVRSEISFSLDASAGVRFVERLMLSGTANINATGNALDNILIGNSGNNELNGGLGNDTLQGGAGSDRFIFTGAYGNDTVTDFDRLQAGEVIDISAIAEIVDFADLVANHLTQSGAGAVITVGANSITLNGVLATTLLADDFVF